MLSIRDTVLQKTKPLVPYKTQQSGFLNQYFIDMGKIGNLFNC